MKTNEIRAIVANWLNGLARRLPVRFRFLIHLLARKIAGTKLVRGLILPGVFLSEGAEKVREIRFFSLPDTMSDSEVVALLRRHGLRPASKQDLLDAVKNKPTECPLGRTLALEPTDEILAVWKGYKRGQDSPTINIFPSFGHAPREKGNYVVATAA